MPESFGQPASIHEAYRAATRTAALSPRHAGEPAVPPGHLLIEVVGDGAALRLVVDSREHVIRSAGHAGATSPVAAGLLETACQVMVGVPVIEAADHGVLVVADRLRDRSQPPPVPGLVLPEAVDPGFAWLRNLMRAAAAAYERQSGANFRANTFERAPAPAWMNLSDDERARRVKDIVVATATRLGLAGGVEVLMIDDGIRVVLGFADGVPARQKQALLMPIERALQEQLEPRLEVCLEELRDRNVIRRLVPPKEMAHGRND